MLLKRPVLAVALLASANAFSQSSPVQVVDINSSAQSAVAAGQSAARALPPTNQNAELIMLIEQLQQEVRYLRGQVEEQAYQMKKLQTNQRDRYRDLDRRILSITQKLDSAPVSTVTSPLPANTAESTSVPAANPVTPGPLTSSTSNNVTASSSPAVNSAQPTGESDKDAYSNAFKLVRARDYQAAITAFDQFIRFYPNSSLVANAIFWTGEVYRAMTPPNYQSAKESFAKLIELYPQHAKAADAHYKLGLTYNDLGEKDQAKATMQKTIDLYPDQSVAGLARDFLAR